MKNLNLKNIIEKKQIYSVFQPVVSLKTGERIGFEVFSRVEIFDSDIEIQNVIKESITEDKIWDLDKICRKSAVKSAWQQGIRGKLFINVDANCLKNKDIAEHFTQKTVERFAVNPSKIVLEISNRFDSVDFENYVETIKYFKSLGFLISIDDVGSSHTGIQAMYMLNPDYIKLDMSLTRSIETDKTRQAMIKSIVEFCKNSGIKTIAKGIESGNELNTILFFEIDYAQGFYIAQPNQIFPKISKLSYSHIVTYQQNQKLLTENNIQNKRDKKSEKKKSMILQEDLQNFTYRPISDLCVTGFTVLPDTLATEVLSLFEVYSETNLSTVIDLNGKVLGVMPKSVLLQLFGGRYGYSLNSRKTIQSIMLKDFTKVNADEPVDQVALKATSRPESSIYDPLVVEKNGSYLGIVTISNLLDSIVSVEVNDRTQEIRKKNKLLQEQHEIQRRDMHMAELVQKSFYPQKAPQTENWDVAFTFKPMSSVSGDVFDFYFTNKGKFFGTGLFDVSGHGVASGLVGILAKYLAERIFREQRKETLDKVIKKFNSVLTKEKGMIENYLTGVFLRIEENKLEYVNAGHTEVLIKKAGETGKKSVKILGEDCKDFRGSFIGIEGLPSEFKVVNYELEPGDTIILYTDCLIESRNLAGDELGVELLRKVFSKADENSAEEILTHITESFEAFTEAVPIRDDLTIIVLKYKGIDK